MVECDICGKEYSIKGIHTHKQRAHGSDEVKAKFSSGHNGKYDDPEYKQKVKAANGLRATNKLGEKKWFKVKCKKCHIDFDVEERASQFPKKEYYHCSRSCANGKLVSDETKKKIGDANRGRVYDSRLKTMVLPKAKIFNDCKTCFAKTTNKSYCSISCSSKRQKRIYNDFDVKKVYKRSCNFKFALKSYPTEFDFSLIEEHGWYAASNHGNNLNGVSRDHMVSVDYGWQNKIDPKIISHPANCVLMQHSDNFRKGTSCSITLDELLVRIEQWNKKYGPLA